MALYFFLLITIGLQLGWAYPSIPEEQPQCIVDWYPKNDRPLYGKTQRMTGPCESFNVKCSYGITLSLNVPEGLGFLGTVIQGCPDQFDLAVPCCLPDIKCGSNLAGRCMNRNKTCNDGAWFSDERCPEGPWSCCERNYATRGINGEDDRQILRSEGGPLLTVEEAGEISQFSWDDLQRFEASVPFHMRIT